jgi:hypothetical protein
MTTDRGNKELRDDLYEAYKDEDEVIAKLEAIRESPFGNPDEKTSIEILKDELQDTFDALWSRLDEAEKKGTMEVWRAIKIPDLDEFIASVHANDFSNIRDQRGRRCSVSGIGTSWAFSWQWANVIDSTCNGETYILQAIVNFNDINIDETEQRHMTSDFGEIRVYSGKEVILIAIYAENKKNERVLGEKVHDFGNGVIVTT